MDGVAIAHVSQSLTNRNQLGATPPSSNCFRWEPTLSTYIRAKGKVRASYGSYLVANFVIT